MPGSDRPGWYRAYKTEHEIAAVRVAAESAAAGHRRAREVFSAGGTERDVHRAYLEAADRLEALPGVQAMPSEHWPMRGKTLEKYGGNHARFTYVMRNLERLAGRAS